MDEDGYIPRRKIMASYDFEYDLGNAYGVPNVPSMLIKDLVPGNMYESSEGRIVMYIGKETDTSGSQNTLYNLKFLYNEQIKYFGVTPSRQNIYLKEHKLST